MKVPGLAFLAAIGFASAQEVQSAKLFTDPTTGISFQAHTSKKGSKFGVALPKNGTTDLIGLLSASKSFTYAGGVLGTTMNGTILLVAWPNGDTVMGSIRKVPDGAPTYAAPPEFSTNISLAVIPKGTFVKPSGDWQYTFVCSGCLDRKDVYPARAAEENFAWVLSVNPLKDPANKSGLLNHHHGGTGRFSVDLASARHEKYPAWAKMVA